MRLFVTMLRNETRGKKKKKSALKMSQIQCQHLCITFVFGLVNLKKKQGKKPKNFGHTFECSVHDTMLLQPFTSFCLRFFCQQGPLKTTNTEHTRKKVGTKQSENAANKSYFSCKCLFFFPYTSSSDLPKKP